jgi:deoxyxylulose-5-phosphate synthase
MYQQYPLLSQVNSPDDVKKLPEHLLPRLAKEIRSLIVSVVSENGES